MSQRRHAASNCCQERALGLVCAVRGADLDQELTVASIDMILPVKMCSGASCSSQLRGAECKDARLPGAGRMAWFALTLYWVAVTAEVGVDTQAGGPRVAE